MLRGILLLLLPLAHLVLLAVLALRVRLVFLVLGSREVATEKVGVVVVAVEDSGQELEELLVVVLLSAEQGPTEDLPFALLTVRVVTPVAVLRLRHRPVIRIRAPARPVRLVFAWRLLLASVLLVLALVLLVPLLRNRLEWRSVPNLSERQEQGFVTKEQVAAGETVEARSRVPVQVQATVGQVGVVLVGLVSATAAASDSQRPLHVLPMHSRTGCTQSRTVDSVRALGLLLLLAPALLLVALVQVALQFGLVLAVMEVVCDELALREPTLRHVVLVSEMSQSSRAACVCVSDVSCQSATSILSRHWNRHHQLLYVLSDSTPLALSRTRAVKICATLLLLLLETVL